jgi:hypothetical protein
MLGVEEKDPVIRGKYADDLYKEYNSVYGESKKVEKIKLSEKDLHNVVKESVNKVVSEYANRGRNHHDRGNPLMLFMTENKRHLVEGLVNTYPLEIAKKHFVSYMNIDPDEFRIERGANNVKVAVIYLEYNEAVVKEYQKAMDFYGYYLASVEHVEGSDGTDIAVLTFEPKYQKNIRNGEDIESVVKPYIEKEKYFIHITPLKHLDKIMKQGLCPRPSEKEDIEYPERIHLLGSLPMFAVWSLCGQLFLKDKRRNEEIYSILILNKDEVLKNAKLSFDPNMIRGYITSDNIPPSAIIKHEEINAREILEYTGERGF